MWPAHYFGVSGVGLLAHVRRTQSACILIVIYHFASVSSCVWWWVRMCVFNSRPRYFGCGLWLTHNTRAWRASLLNCRVAYTFLQFVCGGGVPSGSFIQCVLIPRETSNLLPAPNTSPLAKNNRACIIGSICVCVTSVFVRRNPPHPPPDMKVAPLSLVSYTLEIAPNHLGDFRGKTTHVHTAWPHKKSGHSQASPRPMVTVSR